MESVNTEIETEETAPQWVSPVVAAAAAGEQADFSKHLPPETPTNNED